MPIFYWLEFRLLKTTLLLPLLPFSYGNLIFRKGEEFKISETATSDFPMIRLKDEETKTGSVRSAGRRNLRLATKREEEA